MWGSRDLKRGAAPGFEAAAKSACGVGHELQEHMNVRSDCLLVPQKVRSSSSSTLPSGRLASPHAKSPEQPPEVHTTFVSMQPKRPLLVNGPIDGPVDAEPLVG